VVIFYSLFLLIANYICQRRNINAFPEKFVPSIFKNALILLAFSVAVWIATVGMFWIMPGAQLLPESHRPLIVERFEIVSGKRGITPETAMVLADAFSTTPEFWLNLQLSVDLWKAQKTHKPVKRLAGIAS